VDYCSTVAGASLVAHRSPDSSKIAAWAIPSGWSATLPQSGLRLAARHQWKSSASLVRGSHFNEIGTLSAGDHTTTPAMACDGRAMSARGESLQEPHAV